MRGGRCGERLPLAPVCKGGRLHRARGCGSICGTGGRAWTAGSGAGLGRAAAGRDDVAYAGALAALVGHREAAHERDVRVTGRVATVEVEEWFRNNGGGLGEGDYVYPLPGEPCSRLLAVPGRPGAARRDDGRGTGPRIYEEIVRAQRDPALIELSARACCGRASSRSSRADAQDHAALHAGARAVRVTRCSSATRGRAAGRPAAAADPAARPTAEPMPPVRAAPGDPRAPSDDAASPPLSRHLSRSP
jgi:hypothetical protein